MRVIASVLILLGLAPMGLAAQTQRPNIVLMLVAEFRASTEVYPNVPPNAKDPYTPPARRP